ncbi:MULTISPECIES: coenzyme F420-0:L-glutamate ligase [Paraburkholderia]|uniref:Coenzyme F420-0:L-glutamate ligase n=1 Tax=Paraburkholderia dipogonis TaxID=1211383 RepID=A0A4Y8MGY3_9BURK|nr:MULTISPECIES: coenzyme F420-0:L-glutamate ligase [Paraburkholderia]RKR31280.1 coenzyme F420-0:L-glutamate ligase/coenzyme F420-1:gamma-L-glutamate ligase [Paraburkholderia sp. BL17N1]TFE36746.1 coenzyme F420-0:L-glutamate ligase [Paraburkholderia dipogonis]
MVQILPLTGLSEVLPGDELITLLREALQRQAVEIREDDILVVTQKIVSKAEGRFVDLGTVTPCAEAVRLAETTQKDPRLVQVVLDESDSIVRAAPGVLIARHRLGHVMANAGVDQSNVGPEKSEYALLLPINPDGTAARLSSALGIPVVISDSFGRPWRVGVTSVAIGAAGLPALQDRRGEVDRDGRVLKVTQIAVGDVLATAASLATGEGAEGIPAALVRGCRFAGEARPAAHLVRPADQDLFR